ncbi:hypothetical protein ACOSQ4_027097 [Xanthoceras sorbifolium]
MSSITSSLAFDPSLLLPEEPSLDFQSLVRTFNFNLPLKLDKTNYVNWKAEVISVLEISRSVVALLALVNCFSRHSWPEEEVNGIIKNFIANYVINLVMQLYTATNALIKTGMATPINLFPSNLRNLNNLKLS